MNRDYLQKILRIELSLANKYIYISLYALFAYSLLDYAFGRAKKFQRLF